MKKLAILGTALMTVFFIQTGVSQNTIKLKKGQTTQKSEEVQQENQLEDSEEMRVAAAELERELAQISEAELAELEKMSEEDFRKEMEKDLTPEEKAELAELERLGKNGELKLDLSEQELKQLEAEEKEYIKSLSKEERLEYEKMLREEAELKRDDR